MQIQSLVRELRSHILHDVARKITNIQKNTKTHISFSSLFFLWFLEQTKEEIRKEIWSPLSCEKLRFTQVNWWHQSLHKPHPLDSKLSLQTPQIRVPDKLFLENVSMTQDNTCSDVFFSGDLTGWQQVKGKNPGLPVKTTPTLESQLCSSLPVWPWVGHWIFLVYIFI